MAQKNINTKSNQITQIDALHSKRFKYQIIWLNKKWYKYEKSYQNTNCDL